MRKKRPRKEPANHLKRVFNSAVLHIDVGQLHPITRTVCTKLEAR